MNDRMRAFFLDTGVKEDSLQSVLFGTGFLLILVITVGASALAYHMSRR